MSCLYYNDFLLIILNVALKKIRMDTLYVQNLQCKHGAQYDISIQD